MEVLRQSPQRLFQLPTPYPLWNRRWQVWKGGYLSGSSRHCAPVPNTQSTPCRTARVSCHGRPRLSGRRSGRSTCSTSAHCSSVRSQRRRIGQSEISRASPECLQSGFDPAGENRGFHGYGPGLRKRLHPAVQFPARCSDLAFLVNLTARILDAVADRLLVNIQSGNTYVLEEPPWLFSESTFPLSSAFLYTTRSSLDLAFKQFGS